MPPPTPVTFPELCPLDGSSSTSTSTSSNDNSLDSACSDSHQIRRLVPFLQSLRRPVEVRGRHLAALGVQVTQDAPLEALVPDPSTIPAFQKWDTLKLEDVSVPRNEESRREMNNGFKTPGIVFYLERKKELSYANQVAFRAVRRMPPVAGRELPRLGNSFEFYKNLEIMANYWDDPSDPWTPPPKEEHTNSEGQPGDDGAGQKDKEIAKPPSDPERVSYRCHQGSVMPPEARHNGVTALLKMVAYEFKCNISAARLEPRLHLREPPLPRAGNGHEPRASYFPSGCTFGFRTPIARMDARAGVVEGPIFAISTRGSTNFSTEMDQAIDLGREVVASLVTAQHRAREGREERRLGEGKWWCTKPRWGGGTGGPIGKEVEAAEAKAAADNNPTKGDVKYDGRPETELLKESLDVSSDSPKPILPPPSKLRKLPMRKPQMSIYDNYRLVRPPPFTWDKKVRYMALGKVPGSDLDDVWVVSSLFHHVSFIRVRVPARLLAILDGEPQGENDEKVWGGLEMVRSRWLDLFVAEERIKAMQHIWAILCWAMRKARKSEKDDSAKVCAGESATSTTAAAVKITTTIEDKMDVDGQATGGASDGPCKNQ